MAKFRITLERAVIETAEVEIEADSAAEAVAKAYDEAAEQGIVCFEPFETACSVYSISTHDTGILTSSAEEFDNDNLHNGYSSEAAGLEAVCGDRLNELYAEALAEHEASELRRAVGRARRLMTVRKL